MREQPWEGGSSVLIDGDAAPFETPCAPVVQRSLADSSLGQAHGDGSFGEADSQPLPFSLPPRSNPNHSDLRRRQIWSHTHRLVYLCNLHVYLGNFLDRFVLFQDSYPEMPRLLYYNLLISKFSV